MSLSRRKFLQGLATTSAASVIGPGLLMQAAKAAEEVTQSTEPPGVWKVTGSHWGAFRARIYNGQVAEIKPFELDKHPTDMLNGIKGIIYSPSRIRYPMVRLDWLKKNKYSGETRGNNRFVRVTWDEALDLFYQELQRIQKDYGPWALHAGQTGWRETGQFQSCTSHMQRAVGMHGNFIKKVGDYSTGAGQTILPYVLGSTEVYAQATTWTTILKETKTLIWWSNDPIKNSQVGWQCETHGSYGYYAQLKDKVAKGELTMISVDPVISKSQKYFGCEHQYVNPQTDVPFMLGIAHTLYKENLYDKQFLEIYTLGFDEFLPYLLGTGKDKIEKTPEWAEKICGVKADDIRKFARRLVKDRTMIMFGWAVQRQQHGEQPYWMGAVLASMLGQIGLPGGGISYSHFYSGVGLPFSTAAGPGGFPRNVDEGQEPVWNNNDFKGYSAVIPVARWIDSIMEPGKKIKYNGGNVVLPDIKMMVFSGCNPWNHHQQRNRMKQAFRKLQTVINIDYTWTPTCRFSDIVLPACTQFERNDLDQYGTYSTSGVLAMHKLVDPLYHSKTDFQIFTELTERFGKSKQYTRGMTEMQWIQELYNNCRDANKDKNPMPEFNEFWQNGIVEFKTDQTYVSHEAFRNDPEINSLGTPSGFIEIYSRKIARYNYEHCQGHPMWFEKEERSHGGPKSNQFPFWLQSCHPNKRLHSQMCDSEKYRNTYAVKDHEPVYINPDDAKKKGIKDGDIVRVFNDRGQLLAGAVLSEDYPTGVIRIYEGAWFGPLNNDIGAIDTYGDPNTVTIDIPTSQLAQATSANTVVVDIEKFTGKVPPVTSFSGPIYVS
ncbi:Trimethylamine-N-oxide reductase precursor [Photobacterium malacitanum]|uniref:Trimethylamine-N-oxide reductase n=1 Tax=Photobacterium malacitanum TaxID=2204294 RepID=A0A1Y6M7D7_9GAMM|nr:trimethylamine-N-oxide reductase TorA [Photobacterium malacitanum]SMY32507.1 Trimethylamine-N-oxide reductase precursor [Photobacterium malacitanum]